MWERYPFRVVGAAPAADHYLPEEAATAAAVLGFLPAEEPAR